jgi:ethanolamine ammonia-lyase small subunit
MATDLLKSLRQFTDARIGLERSGGSLSTREWLDLHAAHAAARDAVETPVSWPDFDPPVHRVRSRCRDRREYLLRPDLGRLLAEGTSLPRASGPVLVVADGLSPLAVMHHAASVVSRLRAEFEATPIVLAKFGRVAIGDAIGEAMHASIAVLIGERPGLSCADSLGIYITYNPRTGRTDAERNCISNIREGGLTAEEGVRRASWLIREALSRRLSGVALKEISTKALPW